MAATTKEDVYQKIREGKYNNLSSDEVALIPNANIPDNVREKMGERTKAFMKTMEEKKDKDVGTLEEKKEEEKSFNTPIKNSNVQEISIQNPPTFIKIGNHIFTTQKEGPITLQSQTNFDSPGGVGNVYSDLKRIYGVHPEETSHNYNLLLHNFGIYHKDDSPLFDKGGCTPGSKDALKNILQLGLAYLQAKQNSTKRNKKPLANIYKVDNQIPELESRITKLETMDDSKPVCDINTLLPQKPDVVEPTPNCLQDITMLQNFLNILTLMMGVMSDDEKKKNLQSINLKSLMNIGKKTRIENSDRTKIKDVIQQLLDILEKKKNVEIKSTSTTVGTETNIMENESIQKLFDNDTMKSLATASGTTIPKKLEEVIPFIESILQVKQDAYNAEKQTTQSTHETRMSELTSQITSLEAQIASLQEGTSSRAKELQEGINEKEQEIMQLEQTILALQDDVDAEKAAKQNVQSQLNGKSSALQTKEAELSTVTEEKTQKEAELATAQSNLATLRNTLQTKEAELERITQEKSQTEYARTTAQEELGRITTEKDATIRDLQSQLSAAQSELQTLQTTRATEMNAITSERNTLSDRVAQLEDINQRIGAQLDNLRGEKSVLEKRSTNKNIELQGVRDSLAAAQEAVSNVQKSLADKNASIVELKASLTNLHNQNETLRNSLNMLGSQKTTNMQNLIQEHARRIQELQASQEAAIQQLASQHDNALRNLENRLAESHDNALRQKDEEIASQLQRQKDEFNNQIGLLKNEKDQLQDNLNKVTSEKNKLVNEIGSMVPKLQDAKKSQDLQKEISRLGLEIENLNRVISEKDGQILQLQENLTQIDTLTQSLSNANKQKEELQRQLTALQSTSATEKEKIKQLETQIAAQAQKIQECETQASQLLEKDNVIKTQQAKIEKLTTDLKTLQQAASTQVSNDIIEKRLNIILPYLLVNDSLQGEIKEYMRTGAMKDSLKISLDENKSSMCMIFQMAYSLILYNNTFVDNIRYNEIYTVLNSSPNVLYFFDKTKQTQRLTYSAEEEVTLLKELVSLFSKIFKGEKDYNVPKITEMLSKKDKWYVSNSSRMGASRISTDDSVYSTLDKLFPLTIYGGLYLEPSGKIKYIKANVDPSKNPETTTQSYTRISVLLIMLTQLINKYITPKLSEFVTRCGKSLPPLLTPTASPLARQESVTTMTKPSITQNVTPSYMKPTMSSSRRSSITQEQYEQAAAAAKNRGFGSLGGSAEELIDFEE